MAHQLEIENGEAKMFFVGETPWHKLGKKLDSAPTTAEAIKCAGLDWTVSTRPIQTTDGIDIPGRAATVRDSDQRVLGVVGSKWSPLQNKEAFSWFDPYVESGMATLETAGSLNEGGRIWVLAKLKVDPQEIVPGDEVNLYALLANGHDGTLAGSVGLTSIRVVCANTLAISMGRGNGKILKVRHTAKISEAMTAIRDCLDLASQKFVATSEQYRALARKGVDTKSLEMYVQKVFKPVTVNVDNELTDETGEQESCKTLINKIIPLFEKGRGNDLPGVKGTMWAAFNALTEYLSYERGRNDNNRLNNLWFGQSAKLNQRALDIATQMAA